MIAYALRASIKVNTKRLHKTCVKDDGAVIDHIIGDVVNFFIVWSDRRLKERVVQKLLLINMYFRYIDDINVVVNAPTQESSFEIEVDTNTIEGIQKIANTNSTC